MIETITIDTDTHAVVPRVLPDYRIPLFTQICYGEHAEKLWQDFLAAAPRPEAVQHNDFPSQDAGFGGQPLLWCDDPKQSAPRPVPTSERLPTEVDSDWMGFVYAFASDGSGWGLWEWIHVADDPDYLTHWQPTGLTRPAEPERELSPEFRQAAWDALKGSGKKVSDAKKAEPDGGAV